MLDRMVTIDKERRECTLHSDASSSWSVESWSVPCMYVSTNILDSGAFWGCIEKMVKIGGRARYYLAITSHVAGA